MPGAVQTCLAGLIFTQTSAKGKYYVKIRLIWLEDLCLRGFLCSLVWLAWTMRGKVSRFFNLTQLCDVVVVEKKPFTLKSLALLSSLWKGCFTAPAGLPFSWQNIYFYCDILDISFGNGAIGTPKRAFIGAQKKRSRLYERLPDERNDIRRLTNESRQKRQSFSWETEEQILDGWYAS